MTARKDLLETVEITKPCTANWDEMNGTDQIRYCSECNKYVYALSEMTRSEAEALLASRRDQMCVRLIRDLNGQTLTLESLPPVRLLKWKPGPIASAVVSAMLSIAPAAAAATGRQGPSQLGYKRDESGHRVRRPLLVDAGSAITGIVSNEKGAAIPGAVVTLTGEASGEVLAQITSGEGEFRFDGLPARTYIVEIKANGYQTVKQHDFSLQPGEARRLDVGMRNMVVMMGAVAMPAQPLRTLYLESDRVVVAQVGSAAAEPNGRSSLVRTPFRVSQTIKGDGHKPAIDVYSLPDSVVAGPLTEGETVLAFLQRKEDAPGADSYEPIYGAASVKRLSPSDLATYLQRLDELKAIMSKPDPAPDDIVEWLVQCAEDPLTRREGAFELYISALRARYAKKEADNEELSTAPVDTIFKNPSEQEPLFATMLSGEQKQRLVSALLTSEQLDGDGDFELIELVGRWNDPRLLPFLITHLRRFEETAPESLGRLMMTVAELLDDAKITALVQHYFNSERYDDLQAAHDKVGSADSDADEDVESGQDTEADDDEDTHANDEVADEPELAPEAARQIRVEILKKFLEAVEAKMKSAPASAN